MNQKENNMLQRILVPKTLQPKNTAVNMPKSLMINEQVYKQAPKKLLFGVAGGSVPPPNDNGDKFIKKALSSEQIKRIKEIIRNSNKAKNDGYDIFNKNLIKKRFK